MADDMTYQLESGAGANALKWRHRVAWILVLIADLGFIASPNAAGLAVAVSSILVIVWAAALVWRHRAWLPCCCSRGLCRLTIGPLDQPCSPGHACVGCVDGSCRIT